MVVLSLSVHRSGYLNSCYLSRRDCRRKFRHLRTDPLFLAALFLQYTVELCTYLKPVAHVVWVAFFVEDCPLPVFKYLIHSYQRQHYTGYLLMSFIIFLIYNLAFLKTCLFLVTVSLMGRFWV